MSKRVPIYDRLKLVFLTMKRVRQVTADDLAPMVDITISECTALLVHLKRHGLIDRHMGLWHWCLSSRLTNDQALHAFKQVFPGSQRRVRDV